MVSSVALVFSVPLERASVGGFGRILSVAFRGLKFPATGGYWCWALRSGNSSHLLLFVRSALVWAVGSFCGAPG